MVVNSDVAYRAAAKEFWTKYYERAQQVPGEYQACLATCRATSGGAPCRQKCLDASTQADEDNLSFYRAAIAGIDADAATNYLNLPARIICPPANVELANTLRVGGFADATVVVASTLKDLKDELSSSRKPPLLALVYRGVKGKISVAGDLVSLGELAAITHMQVNDQVYLEGPFDGQSPGKQDLRLLKEALNTGFIKVNWFKEPAIVTVAVDSDDKVTAKVDSTLAKGGADHFVTFKAARGTVRLRASISPGTKANQKALTWTGPPGTFVTRGPVAIISRGSPGFLQLEAGIGGNTRKVVVWIVWVTLAGTGVGPSTADGMLLGATHRRFPATGAIPGEYWAFGRLDWAATIMPSDILVPPDRPAMELQEPAVPDGETSPPPTGFGGWQVAKQERCTTYRRHGAGPGVTEKNEPWGPKDGAERFGDDSTPYPAGSAFGSYLRMDRKFHDPEDPDGSPAIDESYERGRRHVRVFVRVQLGSKWHRCSDIAIGRWHYFAIRKAGEWQDDTSPGHADVADFTNNGYVALNR